MQKNMESLVELTDQYFSDVKGLLNKVTNLYELDYSSKSSITIYQLSMGDFLADVSSKLVELFGKEKAAEMGTAYLQNLGSGLIKPKLSTQWQVEKKLNQFKNRTRNYFENLKVA